MPATQGPSKLSAWNSKKNHGKWIVLLKNIMAPDGPHILTDSLEQAKLDIIVDYTDKPAVLSLTG